MKKIQYTAAMVKDVFDWKRIGKELGKLALLVLLAIIISIVSMRWQFRKDEAKKEAEIAEIKSYYDAKIVELEKRMEYGGEVSDIEREAESIAKVLYGTALNNSEDGQRAVVWCIINRTEHQNYPDTVAEVCRQEQQWMGYSDDNPVLENLYELALAELKVWHNDGHRPMSKDFVFLSWSENEIVLRDKFEVKPNTHYWRVS